MASSSHNSTSSCSTAWNTDVMRQSPIPYRVKPLEYEPAVYCKCNRKAALWISWSDENPGRRYLKCYRYREGGCDYICWYEDVTTTDFVKSLLVDLRTAVRSLKLEKIQLENDIRLAQNCNTELRMALEDTSKKLAAHNPPVDEDKSMSKALIRRNKQLDKEKRRNSELEMQRNLWFGLFVALAIAMVVMWFRM